MKVTRRRFVVSLASAGASVGGAGASRTAEKPGIYPSEIKRYADDATENIVFRMTSPAYRSWLPAPYCNAISKNNEFLIHASDRSGYAQAYRLDLKNGQSRVLTETPDLIPTALTLTPDDRDFAYLAGPSLYLSRLNGGHTREIYRVEDGFRFGAGFSLSEDGLVAALIEEKSGKSRLRLVTMHTGAASTVVESSDPLSDPQPRPKRAGLLYQKGSDLWVVNYDGAQNHKLRIAPGGLGTALWSGDGRAVEYLNVPADKKKLHNIREFTPDTNEDQFVSDTTQYATFNHNADTSVFVGASGSKASPYMLLLLRSVRRELTLCEHKASDPRQVTAFFSPNSQRVIFQSDRHGKMAIYLMAVDRLVADTETEAR